jgi:hypothetical protein
VKVLTSKGIANHTEPESWGFARKGNAQALTGEDAGQPLSLEKNLKGSAASVELRDVETRYIVKARDTGAPRGLRTCTRIETTYTETGRPQDRSRRDRTEVRAENLKRVMRR